MTKLRNLSLGLLLVGAALGLTTLAPTAAADDCTWVYVPTQGWTCVPPENGPCIGYVYDPINDKWRCIPHP